MITPNGLPIVAHVPEYALPVWEGNKVLNKGVLPLWGGKAPPPEVGACVDVRGLNQESVTVLGYFVEAGWLMIWAERLSDGKRGDLAGTEIKQD